MDSQRNNNPPLLYHPEEFKFTKILKNNEKQARYT